MKNWLIFILLLSCSAYSAADIYDPQSGILKLNYVKVGSENFEVELKHMNGKLKLLSYKPSSNTKGIPNTYNPLTGELKVPSIHVLGLSQEFKYQGVFKLENNDDLNFIAQYLTMGR